MTFSTVDQARLAREAMVEAGWSTANSGKLNRALMDDGLKISN